MLTDTGILEVDARCASQTGLLVQEGILLFLNDGVDGLSNLLQIPILTVHELLDEITNVKKSLLDA